MSYSNINTHTLLHLLRIVTSKMQQCTESGTITDECSDCAAQWEQIYEALMTRDGWSSEWATLSTTALRCCRIIHRHDPSVLQVPRHD